MDYPKVIRFSDLATEEKLKLTDEEVNVFNSSDSNFRAYCIWIFHPSKILSAVFFVSIYLGEITIILHKSGLLPVLRALKVE